MVNCQDTDIPIFGGFTEEDFRACTGLKKDSQFLHGRFKSLFCSFVSENPIYADKRFVSYVSSPYSRAGYWRDEQWISFAESDSLPGRPQDWVQFEAAIHDDFLELIVWINYLSPSSTRSNISRNLRRGSEILEKCLKRLGNQYHLVLYGYDSAKDEYSIELDENCSSITKNELLRAAEYLTREGEGFAIQKIIKKKEAIAEGHLILDTIANTFVELTPAYHVLVGKKSVAAEEIDPKSSKEKFMFSNISWNPHNWTKPYMDKNAPHRYVQHNAGLESLNFDFDKSGIDDETYVYGYAEFSKYPVRLDSDAVVFFYSRNYLDDDRGYVVGVYGNARIVSTSVDWKGFENDKLNFNLRAERDFTLRFPVYLLSSKYLAKGERVGQGGIKYVNKAIALAILKDEFDRCLHNPEYQEELRKLNLLYKSISSHDLADEEHTPKWTREKKDIRVEVSDGTAWIDKEDLIDRAAKIFDKNEEPVTSRSKVDLSGLFKETSTFDKSIHEMNHVRLEYATKMGRGTNLEPQSNPDCTGGLIYVEKNYEACIPTQSALQDFDLRMKKLLKAMRNGTEGPNPENIRILVTHAATDAKLFREQGFIGFNVLNAGEFDAFWIMAAAREVAYIKYTERYQHLRLMTELVVRSFRSLGFEVKGV